MLLKFIEQHKILDIGTPLPDELVAELITDAPYEFVETVDKSNFYISRISWWENAKIGDGSAIGFGGPSDPRNPKEFFFSETGICCEFNTTTTIDEYCSYINRILAEFKNVSLVPAFELQKNSGSK